MKSFTSLAFLALALPLSAQFYNPLSRDFFLWSPFFPREPSGIAPDGCTILPRDFSASTRWREPLVDKSEWNVPCILTADVSQAQLANVKRPEEFLNARIAHAFPPTEAVWSSDIALPRETPINPRVLASSAQATRVQERLGALARRAGIQCSIGISENDRNLLGGRADYKDDTRRVYYAGSMLVGLVAAVYASNPLEVADQSITREIREACSPPDARPISQRKPLP